MPLANLITRVVIGLAFLPFLGPVVHWLSLIDPAPARLAVNFHSLFSLVAAVVFMPLIDPMAALARRLLPDKPAADDLGQPRHLDPNVLDTPAEALGCAMRETLYLGDRVSDMLRQTMEVFEKNDQKGVRAIEAADNAVDHLYEAIKLYLVQVSRTELGEDEGRRYIEILTFTTNLEHIGDIIDKNLMELAAKKIKNRLTFSAEGMSELKAFHARVSGEPAAVAQRLHHARPGAGAPAASRRRRRCARSRPRRPTAISPGCARAGRNRWRPAPSTST